MSSKKSTAKAVNNGLIIAIIVAIALLVAVVVGLFVVMQSPDKQIASGFANLIKSETIGFDGKIETTGASGASSTIMSGVTNKKVADGQIQLNRTTIAGAKLNAKVQLAVAEDGAVYAKIDQPKKLMESYATTMINSVPINYETKPSEEQAQALQKQVDANFAAIGDKVENKWIKLTQDDLRSFGGTDKGSDCYVSFAQKLADDAAARKQLAKAYSSNRFFKIDEKLERDGSAQGYRVSVDQAKYKEFKSAVAANESVKKLGDCGTDILTLGVADTLGDQTADIWVDRFSHNITRVKYSKPGDAGAMSNVDIKLSYDKSVSVTAPSDAVMMKDVINQVFAAPATN